MKKIFSFLGIALILIISGAIFYYHHWQNAHTLTIGIYTGSSWDVPDNNQYQIIDYVVSRFKKKYPDVQIKYESGIRKSDYRNWLSEKIVQGDSPDLMIVPEDSFNLLANNGEFKNLSLFMKRDKISDKKFYPVAIKAGQIAGDQYALPYQANPRFMVMNKSLLSRNKIQTPDFNWKPSQLKKICQQLNNSKSEQKSYGITSDYNWFDALLAYGFNFSNNKDYPIQLMSSNAIKGFNLIEYLKGINHLQTNDSQMFDEGKVAFTPMSLAKYRTYTSYPYYVTNEKNFKWDCLQMPHINNVKATQVDISLFAIANKAKNPDLAWKLLKMWCLDKKVQEKVIQVNKGCSTLPAVVRCKKTQKILNQNSQGVLTTSELDQIMRNGWDAPKFKDFNTIYGRLDYDITKALDDNSLDKQLFYIQQRAQENINSN